MGDTDAKTDRAIGAWVAKAVVPVVLAAGLGIAAWAAGATNSHGARIAVVETRATATEKDVDELKKSLTAHLSGIQTELIGLRSDLKAAREE